jgi:hypothetical protein
MTTRRALRWMAAGLTTAALAGCSGVTSTLRYGVDGQPEYFVDCSGKRLARCYDQALETCPQGYFLVKESQMPEGNTSGSIWGRMFHLGASANNTEVKFQNYVVVRCKAPPAPAVAPR